MKKDRNLSTYEFLEALQKEYFYAFLRSRIYPSISQKNYYRQLMDFKKEKIENVAGKNDLPNIFTDDKLYMHYRKLVLGEGGFPKIRYRNQQEKNRLEVSDMTNYYLKGSEVKVVDSAVRVGRITQFDILNETVTVKFYDDESENQFNIKKVTRLL
jgi:hypothetical protein